MTLSAETTLPADSLSDLLATDTSAAKTDSELLQSLPDELASEQLQLLEILALTDVRLP